MSSKIIDDRKINWDRTPRNTLSYKMIFDENYPEDSEPEVDETPDYEEILKENNRMWEQKLSQSRLEAFEAGMEEGRKQGFDDANSLMDQKVECLSVQLKQAHNEWQERQKILDPGVLDLAFELAESILEIPVENPAIRKRMKLEIEPILQRLDDTTKPVLWISEEDQAFIAELKNENAAQSTLIIRVDADLNSGEFRLETNRETVVQEFRTLLKDMKASLNLPSWTA